ncbi:MAG: 4Fe-4S dicluster domain-containing protein [Candidatus Bathyarchaeia archaeon]
MGSKAIDMAEVLNVNQRVLIYHPDKCSGCMLCIMICSFEHCGTFDFKKASIRILEDLEQKGKFTAIYCTHCEHPMCEIVCPSAALFKDKKTGIVQINSMKCVGCKNCMVICPTSAIWFDLKRGVPFKCDLCDGDPKCVRFCYTHALTLVHREEAKKRYGILHGDGEVAYVPEKGGGGRTVLSP